MGLDILLIESDARRRVAVARHLARCNNRVAISSSVDEADEMLRFVTHRAQAPQAIVIGESLLGKAVAFRERFDARFPGARWVPLPLDRDLDWLANWLEAPARPRPRLVRKPDADAVRVLLIEPDDILRATIGARLISRGECVTACSSLQEARAALPALSDAGHAPHAIVSRVSLPDGDGIGFYLAAQRQFPRLRWILIAPPDHPPQQRGLIHRRHDVAAASSSRLSTFSSFHPPTLESPHTPS